MDERTRWLFCLGLRPDASWDDVTHAYRSLIQVWHPDRFAHNARLQEDAQEKLKEINQAYDWLTNNWHVYSHPAQSPLLPTSADLHFQIGPHERLVS